MENKITQYLDSIKSLRPNTIALYHNALRRFFDFSQNCSDIIEVCKETGDLNFVRIKTKELNNYVEYLKASGCTGKTIQQYLTIAKMFYKWLGFPIEYTYRIPASEHKEAKLKAINRWFDELEVEMCRQYNFSEVVNPVKSLRNRAIVALLIDTGCRVKELSMVKVDDINLENQTVFFSDSKTEPRPAFFSPGTKEILEHFKNNMTYIKKWNKEIFPSSEQIQKVVNDMLVNLGLKNGADGRGPHTFRHYVATWLHYEGGLSIMDVAFLLGDTPKTIEDNYIHPTANMLQCRVNHAMGW